MSAVHPRQTYAAEVLEAHTGLGPNALACVRGAVVVVQGDRDSPPDARWCCCNGRTVLVPLSLLHTLATNSFAARALFDFAAEDTVELSVSRCDLLTVTPRRDDPSGWCTATSISSGEERTGLVPQSYVTPLMSGGGSASTSCVGSGVAHATQAQSADHDAAYVDAACVDYKRANTSHSSGGRSQEGFDRRGHQATAPAPASVSHTEKEFGLGHGSERWSGYAGAVRPPIGFFPARAMAEIWDLGLAIARAPATADANRLSDVERQIADLNAQLKGWALAEEQKSHAARMAAGGADAAVGAGKGSSTLRSREEERRLKASQAFAREQRMEQHVDAPKLSPPGQWTEQRVGASQTFTREQRMEERVGTSYARAPQQRVDHGTTRADPPAEQQARLSPHDSSSAGVATAAAGQAHDHVPRHGPGWPQNQESDSVAVQPDARPKPSAVSRVLSFGRRGSSNSSPSPARHPRPPPAPPPPADSAPGGRKAGGVIRKVQRSMSFGAASRRATAAARANPTAQVTAGRGDPAAHPAAGCGDPAAHTGSGSAAGFEHWAREQSIRAAADMQRARSFERHGYDGRQCGHRQQPGYDIQAGHAPQSGHAQQPGVPTRGAYPAQRGPQLENGHAPGLSASSMPRPSPTMGSVGMQAMPKAGADYGYGDHNGQYAREGSHYEQPQQHRKPDLRGRPYGVQPEHPAASQGTPGWQQQWQAQPHKQPW
jgi:hypothetical protein